MHNEPEHGFHTGFYFRAVLDRSISVYFVLGQHRSATSIAQQLHKDNQGSRRIVDDVHRADHSIQ